MKVTELLKKLNDTRGGDHEFILDSWGSGRIEVYETKSTIVSWQKEDEMNEKLNSLWADLNNPDKWEI